MAGWLVVLGGLAALGVSGRPSDQPGAGAIASVGATVAPRSTPLLHRSVGGRPSASPAMAPVQTSGPGPIQLQARRHPETIFVHGDVFGQRITWVFVSLQGEDGRVAGWASVSVPGSASEVGSSGRPALRFDVEVAVPADFSDGPLLVQATAYDALGSLVATAVVRMASAG